MPSKKAFFFLSFAMITSIVLVGCNIDLTGPEKVKGDSLTYSEYFKPYDRLDERGNVQYYKPVPIDDGKSILPEHLNSAIIPLESEKLPFLVNEEKVYLITSKDKEGTITNQVQYSYLNETEDEFFIVSMTEAAEDPLKSFDYKDKQDTVGNELRKEILTDDIPIYHQVITTDSSLLYSYYQYDENENRIVTVGTAANEFFSFYNGYVYHIGYLIDQKINTVAKQEEMLQLAREFILGKQN